MVSLCFVHPNSTLVFCAIYPAFPQKWLRLQKLQFFLSQFPLPSLEGDNNIYINIYILLSIIITYNLKVLEIPYTPSAENCNFCNRNHCNHLRPEPTVTGRSEGGSKAARPVKCDVLGYKKADNAVRLHIKSSDTVKRSVARPAKNCYGVCEGKGQY